MPILNKIKQLSRYHCKAGYVDQVRICKILSTKYTLNQLTKFNDEELTFLIRKHLTK